MGALTILKSSSRRTALERAGGASEEDQPVLIATRLRLRGPGGRLTAFLVPAGIDQFRGRSWVLVGQAGGPVERQEIEEYTVYGRKVILKLRGVDTLSAAEPLVGLDIFIPCKGLVDLPEGAYYIFELVGMKVVTSDGRDLGTVRDVVETGGTPLLSIAESRNPAPMEGRKEILVPMARSICKNIDTASGTITVDLPEGLLELYGI
jgi:16S rRNA processing protein RimM